MSACVGGCVSQYITLFIIRLSVVANTFSIVFKGCNLIFHIALRSNTECPFFIHDMNKNTLLSHIKTCPLVFHASPCKQKQWQVYNGEIFSQTGNKDNMAC